MADIEKQLLSLQNAYSELFNERKNVTDSGSIAIAKNIGKEAKAFGDIILTGGKKIYSDVEKRILLNINYRSSHWYRFMRSSLSFPLPHPRPFGDGGP